MANSLEKWGNIERIYSLQKILNLKVSVIVLKIYDVVAFQSDAPKCFVNIPAKSAMPPRASAHLSLMFGAMT